jgi:hypothetical protein
MVSDPRLRSQVPGMTSFRAGLVLVFVGALTLASAPAMAQRTGPRGGSGSSSQPLAGQFKPSQPLAGRNSGFAQTNFARFPVLQTPLPNVPVTNIPTP